MLKRWQKSSSITRKNQINLGPFPAPTHAWVPSKVPGWLEFCVSKRFFKHLQSIAHKLSHTFMALLYLFIRVRRRRRVKYPQVENKPTSIDLWTYIEFIVVSHWFFLVMCVVPMMVKIIIITLLVQSIIDKHFRNEVPLYWHNHACNVFEINLPNYGANNHKNHLLLDV